jgi:hypothetical protein
MLTATGVPLAGEVVALTLGAILDDQDRQLEQLKGIQADTQALLRGPYQTGMIWLREAAVQNISEQDQQDFIEKARDKFMDALGQEHEPFRKALIEYQLGNSWTLLGNNQRGGHLVSACVYIGDVLFTRPGKTRARCAQKI